MRVIKTKSFHLRCEQQERRLSWQRKSKETFLRHIWKMGPETRDYWWDPRSETQHPKCGAWDLGPWKRIFRKFSQFFLKSCDYELIHVLFAFILCFLLPYHTAYALLIFYHLNVLLLPSYCKNFHHAAAMKSLNFRENQW